MKAGPPKLTGVLIVLLGVAILVHTFFNLHIPLVSTVFGILVIYLGLRIAAEPWVRGTSATPAALGPGGAGVSVFRPAESSQPLKYDVVFGRGVVDLTHIHPVADTPTFVEVNVVFATAVLVLDPALPYEIEASSVFGAARFPEQPGVAFGTVHYPPAPRTGEARLKVKLSVVFGSAVVQEHAGELTDTSLPVPG